MKEKHHIKQYVHDQALVLTPTGGWGRLQYEGRWVK
jgi:hypothetical protein